MNKFCTHFFATICVASFFSASLSFAQTVDTTQLQKPTIAKRVASFFSNSFGSSKAVNTTQNPQPQESVIAKKPASSSHKKRKARRNKKKIIQSELTTVLPQKITATEAPVEKPEAKIQHKNNRKTEGNYFGGALALSKMGFYQKQSYSFYDGSTDTTDRDAYLIKPAFSDKNNLGFSLSYKHAFNFDNFFIAPGIAYDFLNASVKGGPDTIDPNYDINNQETELKARVKDRYVAKVDFGYDINETFSPYITAGYGIARYKTRIPYISGYDGSYTTQNFSRSTGGYIYGVGLKSNLNDNTALNIEYNVQSLLLKTSPLANDPESYITRYVTKLQTLTIGITRKF